MFWVDRSTFDENMKKIFPHLIEWDEGKALYSSGSSKNPTTWLAGALRWLDEA
jgi:hypothetical protein